ncbi:hypothetical protein UVI_02025300 [Ustilaginoidea virens]|uniref:Uncharacterized protein n=1 Tax=Ustilaginoidea virens TaxID=1159556 RepID=A0A1B5KR36_USTVR|nr:hypothetical protein UVI_02025300 [Ustilaginoidea virens]
MAKCKVRPQPRTAARCAEAHKDEFRHALSESIRLGGWLLRERCQALTLHASDGSEPLAREASAEMPKVKV